MLSDATTVIYDPRSEASVPVQDYSLAVDVTVKGLRIGLVSNGFPDATKLMTQVGLALEDVLDSPQITLFERRDSTRHLTEEELQQIVAGSDAVVTAIGHCGSCTSSAVRDSVLVARSGLPAVSLIAAKFWDSANYVARSVGMPDVPRIRLPYPVAGSGAAGIARIAREAVDEIVSKLAGR